MNISLTINLNQHSVDPNSVDPKSHSNALDFLRNELGLTGTKLGCSMGDCGACNILVDGVVAQACQLSLNASAGVEITTIEGILDTELGKQIAEALTHHEAAQCGYCLPGIVVAAYGELMDNENPNLADALQRNLCRCGTHHRILKALRDVIATKDGTK